MSRYLRLATRVSLLAMFAALLLNSVPASSTITPADPPYCATCPQREYFLNSFVSLTEAYVADQYSVVQVRSAFGPTLDFQLTYDSYNADGSRNLFIAPGSSIDTVMGYGWTHTYNDLLFSQPTGDKFRLGPDGRITRFALQNDGTYQTSPGYFETLVKNNDGSFDLTTKYQTDYHYATVPNTPFVVDGPVFRLISVTDRNNNVTSLAYDANGNLITITDSYNRSISLTYNSNHHLISVADPLGNTTTFTYNGAGNQLTVITDPNGKTTTYSYDAFHQITSKTDRDGRQFTFLYQNNHLPSAEKDGAGNTLWSLTNTSNWSLNLAETYQLLTRVFIPSTTVKTDGRGNVWQYTYDSNGHPTQVTAPDGTVTTYTFDPGTEQVATVRDANGHTTTYTYDTQGNLLTRTDALGNVTAYTYDSTFNQLLSVTDPQGRVTRYTIDGHGNRTSETDPLGGTRTWTYDSHGNVLVDTDKNEHPTTYTYDSYGNRAQMTDALGDLTKYTYDMIGNLTSTTDADGNTTTYQYDALYRQTLATDPYGHTKLYGYDNEGDRTAVTDENSHTTSYMYDLRRRLVLVVDALNGHIQYAYDANNNEVSVTDQNNHQTSYSYDMQNRLMKTTDALGDMATYSYDGVGNLACETDANNHQTCYSYDAVNRRIKRTDALNEMTMYGYDLTGLPGHPECTGPTLGSNLITKQTDANGKVIYYCYDGLDRLIIEVHKQGNTNYEIDPGDAVTYYSYDPNSNRLTWQQPNGNITSYTYDAVNRLVLLVQVQTGDTTATSYDPYGNIKTVTAPNGNVTVYMYDALNRRISESDSDGPVSTTTYDNVGNIIGTTDGDGNLTTYTYDALNRRATMTDPLGGVTRYSYDPVGNLLTVRDRLNNTTTYTYDAINRRLTITDAQPATTTFQYDAVGNQTAIIDANGHTILFNYDAVNRKISEIYPDHSNNTVTYAYDSVGNIKMRTDQRSQVTTYMYTDLYFLASRTYTPSGSSDTYTYDLSGRVVAGTRTGPGGTWMEMFGYDGSDRPLQSTQNGQTITYSYNVPGRTRTIIYPGGRTVVEQKDYRDFRLLSENDGGPTPIVQYTYDAANNILSRTYRNGAVETLTYNANNWACSIMHNNGANLIAGFNYAYDAEGNKYYEEKLHASADSQAYIYDSVYRLIDYKVGTLNSTPDCVTPRSISAPTSETMYTLDKLGNWLIIVTTPGGTQTRAFTPSNEIAALNGKLNINDYDGDEDRSYDYTESYAYDEEERLTQANSLLPSGGVMEQDQYDAFNRRVGKTSSDGTVTYYYYDVLRSIEEQSPSGMTQATYVFGDDLDEALTMDRINEPGPFYLHQNDLDSVFALTDSTGTAVEGYSYQPYGYQTIFVPMRDGTLWNLGRPPGGGSSYGNPFLFTGQRYDPETDLFYYKNRYYSTEYGRFVSRDPLDYDAGDPNLYEYVVDSPSKFIDPIGEQSPQDVINQRNKDLQNQKDIQRQQEEGFRRELNRVEGAPGMPGRGTQKPKPQGPSVSAEGTYTIPAAAKTDRVITITVNVPVEKGGFKSRETVTVSVRGPGNVAPMMVTLAGKDNEVKFMFTVNNVFGKAPSFQVVAEAKRGTNFLPEAKAMTNVELKEAK